MNNNFIVWAIYIEQNLKISLQDGSFHGAVKYNV